LQVALAGLQLMVVASVVVAAVELVAIAQALEQVAAAHLPRLL
jgi:hypothetical protein